MGNLATSLFNAANTLRQYEHAFNAVQQNIANVNTAGYVKQNLVVTSEPFSVTTASARSAYLEASVRDQQELLGYAEQKASDLGLIETQFDIQSEFGIPGALNRFFDGFSDLAVNPNDPVSRQSVLDLAAGVAQSFNQSAAGLTQVEQNVQQQTVATVDAINHLAERIANINQVFRRNFESTQDAGLDAELNAALEELSGLVNYSVLRTEEGIANVYLGGQRILVIGDRPASIRADFVSGQTIVRNEDNEDVSHLIQRGRLGALVDERNTILPAYKAELDATAKAFADEVNTQLAAGVDQNGAAPPINLFSYGGANPAFTLTKNNLAPSQIAAATPTAPGGNANAIAISQIGTRPVSGGFTLSQMYGNLGARVGRDVTQARQERSQFQDTVAQARGTRTDETGVSLDEEAVKLLQFQRAYEATGRLITILSQLTESVLGLLR